ncbi:MAG: hypothetical protein QM500_07040 [Methylococcales bacterium]
MKKPVSPAMLVMLRGGLGTPDITSSVGSLSKSDSVLMDHITNGFQSEGSPMAMPPKGGNPNLSETESVMFWAIFAQYLVDSRCMPLMNKTGIF